MIKILYSTSDYGKKYKKTFHTHTIKCVDCKKKFTYINRNSISSRKHCDDCNFKNAKKRQQERYKSRREEK